MHRLTARLLLIFLLAGTFVPAALAITAEPPHACCMRKMHSGEESQLRGVNHRHDCCGPLAVPQWAQPRPPLTDSITHRAATLHPHSRPAHPDSNFIRDHSGRGPPNLSIA